MLQIEDWGKMCYADAFERQKVYVEERLQGTRGNTLVFTEHFPVYTFGVRPGTSKNLLLPLDTIRSLGIDVVQTNRGGDITFHNPKQVVGYLIFQLKPHELNHYLRSLETVLIHALQAYQINATVRPGYTGVWVGPNKIAAIGVAVRRRVAYHGFALNVQNDLAPFDHIIPCGIHAHEGGITSMHALLKKDINFNTLKCIIAHYTHRGESERNFF